MLGATRNNGIGKNYSEQAKKNDFFTRFALSTKYELIAISTSFSV